ncbi:hypothetical protein CEE69_25140 [Rhodopirellula bahusiensis]|uniref:Uncharacterized protein n=1 Tax=Rhodopirellula bahusiensis TaxID=2014065 RepID=A0A2G1W1J8_9BACT|nr:hypothetical protein CEE69_25140 [Rhodopirellula bahusiensis]
MRFFDAAFRQIPTRRTSPETKFGERSSDAVQAYARVRAEHGKRRTLPSPEFSLNARIPILPNCVQEADFNLASTALQNCTTSVLEAFWKTSRLHRASPLSPRMGQSSVARGGSPETDAEPSRPPRTGPSWGLFGRFIVPGPDDPGNGCIGPSGLIEPNDGAWHHSTIHQQECVRSSPVQRFG